MARIHIDLRNQSLNLCENGKTVKEYPISSAKNGVGEQNGSEKTPRGRHIIRAKIGADAALNTVFKARRPTGEIYTSDLCEQYPGRDWILTRILWLSGCEVGKNRLGELDTMRRYIYIHGTPDSTEMDKIGSKGCIRMRNRDIIDLYDIVEAGIEVTIA